VSLILGYSLSHDAVASEAKSATYSIHSISGGVGIDASGVLWETETKFY